MLIRPARMSRRPFLYMSMALAVRALLIGLAVFLLAAANGAEPSPLPADTLPKELSFDVPLGLRPIPDVDAKRVTLGRRLFFDPILSSDKTVACGSCHRPDHGFA